MTRLIKVLLFFVCFALQPAFADAPKNEPLPENFTEWEKENSGREAAQEGRYGELWNKTLMLLIVMLLILFAGTWYLKKFGVMRTKETAKDARIQLIEKRVISPKAVVYLLTIDGHKVALSETSSGVQVLQEFGSKEVPIKQV